MTKKLSAISLAMKIDVHRVQVDLTHLAPIVRSVDLDLRGNLKKKNARVKIRFSCHCYSRGPRKDEIIAEDVRIRDGPADKPRDRIFCAKRYGLSLGLVGHLDELITKNGMVRKTRHLNFYATPIMTVDENGRPVERCYYIFMDATKRQDPGQPPKIAVFVESAYLEDPAIPGPAKVGKPLRLSEVLGQVWEHRR